MKYASSVPFFFLKLYRVLRRENAEEALRDLIKKELKRGIDRNRLIELLADYRVYRNISERDDNLILDALSVLGGWASDTAIENLFGKSRVEVFGRKS